MQKFFFIGMLLLITVGNAASQSCCSGGTPLTGNLGMNSMERREWLFRLSYDYNFLDDLISESTLLENNTRNRTTQSILLQTSYGISNKWVLTALFSLVKEQQETFVLNEASNLVSQSGFGDAFLMLQYSVVSHIKRELLVAAGPKIPIGKTDARDEVGILLPPDLQPGSGSWDAVAGFSYREFHLLNQPQLALNLSAGYKYSGKSSRFEGDENYRFGNEFIASLGVSKVWQLKKTTLTPAIQTIYRTTQPDVTDGFDLPSTGGEWVYLNPGLSVIPHSGIEVNIGGDIPLYRNLNGTQLSTSYRINIGVSYRIKSK